MSLNWVINIIEATKNISCHAKGKCAVDHSTVTKWFKKFCICCKKLNDHTRSGRPKSVDSEVRLQAIEANPANSTWKVSGKFSLS